MMLMCSRFSFFGTTELCGSYRQTLRELDVDPSSTPRLYRRTGGRPVNRSRTSTIPPLYRDSNTAKKKMLEVNNSDVHVARQKTNYKLVLVGFFSEMYNHKYFLFTFTSQKRVQLAETFA